MNRNETGLFKGKENIKKYKIKSAKRSQTASSVLLA